MKKILIILAFFSLSLSAQYKNLWISNSKTVVFQGSTSTWTYNVPNLYLSDSITTGTDANMDGANNWVTGLGVLSPDMTTNPGTMTLAFTSGNQAVKLVDACVGYVDLQMQIKIRRISGTQRQKVQIGRKFGSTVDEDYVFVVYPTDEWNVFTYTLRVDDDVNGTLWIGTPSAFNLGNDYEIDYFSVMEVNTTVEANEQTVFANIPITNNVGNLYDSVQSFTGNLAKVAIFGNSIMGNYYGGTVPTAEGETANPPRMPDNCNNVPRRIYEKLLTSASYNRATFRRSDHTDWTLNGTWSENDGTADVLPIVNPRYTAANNETKWNITQTANDYAEIIIPDGYENFAIILHQGRTNFTTQNQDVVDITLNGGSIAAYGDAVINSYRNTNSTYRGDAFYLTEYASLPSGANTIRIANGADAESLVLWGIMYWTGQSLVVANYGDGGQDHEDLWNFGRKDNQIGVADFIERRYDFVFFENTGMNDNAAAMTLNESQRYFELLSNISTTQNFAIYTTHPFGCSDGSCTTNYYTLYDTPQDLKRRYDRLYNKFYYNDFEVYNIFRDFESYYDSQGWTLESGEGAKVHTSDGQHPNEAGADKWIEFLNKNILK